MKMHIFYVSSSLKVEIVNTVFYLFYQFLLSFQED